MMVGEQTSHDRDRQSVTRVEPLKESNIVLSKPLLPSSLLYNILTTLETCHGPESLETST